MTVKAPPTYPIVDRVGPVRTLVFEALNPDGTIADPAAYDRLNAILDAAVFIGPAVEVTR